MAPLVQPGRLKVAVLPAPMGGLNTMSGGGATPPDDCLTLWNLVAGEYGLRTRLGSREWATGLDGQVRSLLPFTGSQRNGAGNRLFACTQTGIWDVTDGGGSPAQVVTFATQGDDSGWGISTVFVTAAGAFLCYTDEANGYYTYSENTSTWTKVSGAALTGVDPAHLCYVMPMHNALWFAERDTGNAWYLPPGQITGAATRFAFGNKFAHGGDLRGLWGWTRDGSSGSDDLLVAISGAGDVLAYSGVDPSQATGFRCVGAWFVGAVPAGRRLCTDAGGDLLVMTTLGLLPMSKLSSGTEVQSTTYETFKVANLFNQLQVTTSMLRGWAARLHPADNTMMVIVPTLSGDTQQLVMSLPRKSWSQYRGLPASVCAEAFAGTLFLGTDDGRVVINDGYIDGLKLDGTGGTPIDFSLITSFQDLGRPTFKRVQFLRPTFLSQGAPPQYSAQARYRWDLTEAQPPATPGAYIGSGSRWDSGTWDSATFGSGEGYQSQQGVFGATGSGPQVALAIAGTASARMSLVSVDVAYDEGGLL